MAYRTAASTFRDLPESVAVLSREGRLTELDGIGPAIDVGTPARTSGPRPLRGWALGVAAGRGLASSVGMLFLGGDTPCSAWTLL